MTGVVMVLCTCANREEATRLGNALIESRLAACINIVPEVQSIYRWQGAIENTSEALLLIKTGQALFQELSAEIMKLHSYAVPEILALPVAEASQSYLGWMIQELRPTAGGNS